MLTARISIIGGGLAGLHAASLLEAHGVHDYVLLEAQETLGGRVLSVTPPMRAPGGQLEGSPGLSRFDLGATWFWPGVQPELEERIR